MKSSLRIMLACGVAVVTLPHAVVAAAQSDKAGEPAAPALVLASAADDATGATHVVMQASPADAGGRQTSTEQVVVTGSRIANSAAQAPTPVTSLKVEQLALFCVLCFFVV